MRQEIINYIKDKHKNNSKIDSLIKKVNEELDIMEETVGLENKNNLKIFYNIWKNSKGKCGVKNDINSWTAYALGMTSKKPDGDFLPERRAFARAGFPDIDTDFDYENRDKIYNYIIDKYGRENVGNIGTHGLLKFKSCVTRVVKALDIADAWSEDKNNEYISKNVIKVNEILSPFPSYGILKIKDEDGNIQIIKNFDDAYEHSKDFRYYIEKYPEIGKHCRNIEGTFANYGCLSRYTPILTNKGWIRIDQINKKFKIAFINNDKKISYTKNFKSFKTGNKKIYRMKLKNGGFIDVTDEHLIFTNMGCVKFEEIRKDPQKYKIYGLKKRIL